MSHKTKKYTFTSDIYNDNIRHIFKLETRDYTASICFERGQLILYKPKIMS